MGAHRLLCWVFVVVVGALVFASAPALAAPLEAPELTVESVTATSATLHGVLNPLKASGAGTYEFLYKQGKAGCAGGTKVPVPAGMMTGTEHEEVYERIPALTADSEYTACVRVVNTTSSPSVEAMSPAVTFTTAIPPETPLAVGPAKAITATTATLEGVLNPHAAGNPGSYEFLYKQSASECEGEGASGGSATGATPEPVSSEVTGLLPHKTYTFCLRAHNQAGEASALSSPPVTFTTLVAAPEIEESSVSDIASGSVTLSAKVNPEGAPTTYAFEYAPAGGAFTPVAEPQGQGSLPEGDTGIPVGVHVQQGLLPNTAYEFRLVTSNPAGTVTGEPISFTTQTVGSAFSLPDGRQWEMVSPPDKHGALIETDGLLFEGVDEAAANGGAITYLADSPTESEPQGLAYVEQVLSTRGSDGWSSQDIDPPNSSGTGLPIGQGQEYRFFSSDLSRALLEPQGEFTQFSGEETSPVATERTPYLRSDFTCETTRASCYTPLVTAANVPTGTEFGGPYEDGLAADGYAVQPVGGTPDLSHVVLESPIPLTSPPVESGSGEDQGLYEWSASQLQLVSVLPKREGGPISKHVLFGSGEQFIGGEHNAISVDGSRIIWSIEEKALYMRDTVTDETVRIGGAGAEFTNASSDDSKVFFTQEEGGDVNLYVFEVTSGAGEPLSGKVTQLTKDAEVQGPQSASTVLGASEDGSYVYFAARGALTQGANDEGHAPVAGEDNLYVEHYNGSEWEAPRFIAALPEADSKDWYIKYLDQTSRSSPDGRYLEFMSQRSLTGYDNRDANSGEPDEEVYLYDADANAGGGKLVCASCNPTGARPVGEEYKKLNYTYVGGERVWSPGTWLAANVPVWTAYEFEATAAQPRYLSNSGRLFFNSHEALVPQDVNGTWDVYEYEPEGVGSCAASSTTFSYRSNGCIGLISSGESAEESAFLDASESGSDVFFLTAQRLVSQDVDNDYDVYDAHECTTESPCFPTPVEQPPSCTTEASCRPAPTPQPEIFGPPPSATFNGAGNAPSPPVAPAPRKATKKAVKCKKGKKLSHGKCVKKSKSKKKTKAHRANNDWRASR